MNPPPPSRPGPVPLPLPPATGPLKRIGLVVAPAALIAIASMPTPAGLPVAGQMMLGILAFAVIGALMIFLLAYAPDAAKPTGTDMGTRASLGLALSGFSNSAVALVAAACFIAAAMTATGLDRSIALSRPCCW